jgi:hypothetical protein
LRLIQWQVVFQGTCQVNARLVVRRRDNWIQGACMNTLTNLLIATALLLFSFAALPFAEATGLETLPAVSPHGASVIVRGTGYASGMTVYLSIMDMSTELESELDSTVADAQGRIFQRIDTPELAPKDYLLLIRDRSGDVLGQAIHRITLAPELTLTPSIGFPGTPISVDLGEVAAGSVEIVFGGMKLLGPVAHTGGRFSGEFLVPDNGSDAEVWVEAIARAGGQISAISRTVFERLPLESQAIRVADYVGPSRALDPGERFNVSGRFVVPSNLKASDFELTLVWITGSGILLPINFNPIVMDQFGNFSTTGVAPSLAVGMPFADWGVNKTDALGLVYKNPTSNTSGISTLGPIAYNFGGTQQLTIHVTDSHHVPLENAVVTIETNSLLVDVATETEDLQAAGISGRAAQITAYKPSASALFDTTNQFESSFLNLLPSQGNVNPVTGCPITLGSGVTDANGDFVINSAVQLQEFLADIAQAMNQADINTGFSAPGFATFSVIVSAVHLGHGLANSGNVCTGQRFDFQYNYKAQKWFQADGIDGDFDIPFDPANPMVVILPECGSASIGIPAAPYMPDMPFKEVTLDGAKIREFGTFWHFPLVPGTNFTVGKVPQLRLPHLSSAFGSIVNPRLFFGNVDQGPLTIANNQCSDEGVEYAISLPQLATMPPQTIHARVVGSLFSGAPVERPFRIRIEAGPTWIYSADYQTRSINWRPEKVLLTAHEPALAQDANANNVPQGVGNLDNDNATSGTVTQQLFPTHAASRSRVGGAGATVANSPGDSVSQQTAVSPGPEVKIGIDEWEVILDTGKIPLFRYVWGIPPIASATLGADIWFMASYYYYGDIKYSGSQMLMDLTTAVKANVGLDLWLDASILFDIVSANAQALPSISLALPLVVTNNKFNSAKSEPCFTFLLDVAFSVTVGWCPLCLEASGEENLIKESAPDNCAVGPSIAALSQRAVPPATDRIAMAVDGVGQAMMVWGDATGMINVHPVNNGLPGLPIQLPASVGAMGPDVAYLDTNHAVMVWAQSSLSEADFFALEGHPELGVIHQHMVYRTWDGADWSETADLTAPTTGDGGVVLASCPASDPVCPATGEVLAVWVNDAAADLSQHALRLRYAFFDGLAWTVPADIDPGSSAKDVQPTATYMNGDPVIAWVRNDSISRGRGGVDMALNQRRIAYRFVRQSAGVQIPAGLAAAVASPSLTSASSNSIGLAYSVATETDAFIGTRRSLHTALGTSCSAGICNWSGAERKDSQGRRIFIERPKLSRNNGGQGVVAFRQLGTEYSLSGDAPGVTTHTGNLSHLVYDFDSLVHVSDPIAITIGHQFNWQINAVFDPSMNTLMTVALQGSLLSGQVLASLDQPVIAARGVSSQRLGTSDVMLHQLPMIPDFEIIAAETSRDWVQPGEVFELRVDLRNAGPQWEERVDLVLATYWNGPPHLGLPGAQTLITSLPLGITESVSLEVFLPEEFLSDDVHDLYVVVNPAGLLAESDAANNTFIIPMGLLPVPQNLIATDGSASGLISINWDRVDDERVTGYRVYRTNPDGSVVSVGTSHVAGFADFSAYPDQSYLYQVVSHSARLMESAPSEAIAAQTFTRSPGQFLFRDRFQAVRLR